MRHLQLALYAEGPTDLRYFSPLLIRLCQDLCAQSQIAVVENVHVRCNQDDTGSREANILTFASDLDGQFDLLFIHADGAGSPSEKRLREIQPGADSVTAKFGAKSRVVGLVPIREMEAWPLADGSALRTVLGTTLSDAQLGLPPKASQAEHVTDPKQRLDEAISTALASRRRRRRQSSKTSYDRYLKLLGETASLACLRNLSAFRDLEQETEAALSSLNVIR